ncbi:GntR family transcriptional regulator [Streptomyces malaysiensis]|uniref:GntR family transcriptional regulator n=1 Tax=Streptomyces malaysiensis TaxID=92644 RepID=UPI000852D52F|nr:GntR family transcriptional regulator [Streptomyces sp. SPMA113]
MEKRSPSHATTPRIHEIADDLRVRIGDDEFAVAGGKLPSTRMLSEHYGISPQAIARVIAILKAEGTVWSQQGKGVFARAWNPLVYRPQSEFKDRAPDLDVFKALLGAEGRDGEQTINEVLTMPAEEPIRRRLQLKEGEVVALRRRTSVVDGHPFFTDDSYVPLHLVDGSDWMYEGNIERGTNQVLAELGHELVTALDEIYTRMPQPAEMPRLNLRAGNLTPVFELISTAHDRERRPVQVTTMLMPADRNVIVYERKRYPTRNGDA